MRFYLRLEPKSAKTGKEGKKRERILKSEPDSNAKDVIKSVRQTKHGWRAVENAEQDTLVDEMAERLPDVDLHRFLGTVRYGLRSSTIDAGLTVSQFEEHVADQPIRNIVVRAFMAEEQEAALAALGLRLANHIIGELSDLRVADMVIWQHGNHRAVLVGDYRPQESVRSILRENPPLTVLSLVSGTAGFFLVFMTALQYLLGYGPTFMGDASDEWLKRLVGPLATAFLTSTVGLYSLIKNRRLDRLQWDIQGEAPTN